MNAEEVMDIVEHITLSPDGDETRLIFYMLQALACIAVSLEHLADNSEKQANILQKIFDRMP